MIDKRLEKVIHKLKSIHLTVEEKDEVLSRTLSVIDKVEAVSIISSADYRPIKSPFVSKIISYIEYQKFVPAFVIAGLLFLSGGVSLAAENALPGDTLYGLKKVNEQILGFAAVTPQAQAKLAIELNERRLQEVATLSARGKLNDETKNIIKDELTRQADEVKNKVASLVSQNDLDAAQEVAINYESSLKAHEVLLEKVSSDQASKEASDSSHISSLLAVVRDELATSTVARVDLQNKDLQASGNSLPKAQTKLAEVVTKLQEVQTLKANATFVSSSSVAVVTDNINEALKAIEKAKHYIASNQPNEAVIVIQQAGRFLSDAQSSITAEKNADSDVKKALTDTPTPSTDTTATSTATTTASTTKPSTSTNTSASSTTSSSSSSTTVQASSTTEVKTTDQGIFDTIKNKISF